MIKKNHWSVLFLLALVLIVPIQAEARTGQVRIQWLGQSAMKITTPGGKVIMIDPFLTQNPKTPARYKHLRALGHVDLILVTHAHQDHLGDAPALAKMNHAPLYAPSGLARSLVALDIVPEDLAKGMNKGGTVQPLGSTIRISMIHADHSSELAWTNPRTGKKEVHIGGEPAGFIIQLENGFRIYHMGDTALFGDMKLIHDYYRPDLIMIPIGGYYTMGPREAAYATRVYLRPRYAIPMHYGTTPLLKGTPAEYRRALGHVPTKVLSLQPGETVVF